MKIEIRDDKEIVVLSNEHLDNNNFVGLTIINEDYKESMEMTVNIDQLSAAVSSFVELRELELERNKLYEDM